jgi:hypothetical protein
MRTPGLPVVTVQAMSAAPAGEGLEVGHDLGGQVVLRFHGDELRGEARDLLQHRQERDRCRPGSSILRAVAILAPTSGSWSMATGMRMDLGMSLSFFGSGRDEGQDGQGKRDEQRREKGFRPQEQRRRRRPTLRISAGRVLSPTAAMAVSRSQPDAVRREAQRGGGKADPSTFSVASAMKARTKPGMSGGRGSPDGVGGGHPAQHQRQR